MLDFFRRLWHEFDFGHGPIRKLPLVQPGDPRYPDIPRGVCEYCGMEGYLDIDDCTLFV